MVPAIRFEFGQKDPMSQNTLAREVHFPLHILSDNTNDTYSFHITCFLQN